MTAYSVPDRARIVAIVAAVLFVLLSVYVQRSAGTLDAAAEGFFDRYSSRVVSQFATDITSIGGAVVALTIAGIVAAILLLVGHPILAALLPSGILGSSALSALLKLAFRRARPDMLDSPVFFASGSSYPSGHATTGTVLMLLLAYVIHRLGGDRPAVTRAAVIGAVIMIGLIGLSRVYLGVHHPTDVVGGILVGTVWATVCMMVVDRRLAGADRQSGQSRP